MTGLLLALALNAHCHCHLRHDCREGTRAVRVHRAGAHRANNPFGRAGGVEHRAALERLAKLLAARGRVEREVTISTPNGLRCYRSVDVAVADPKTGKLREAHFIGVPDKSGRAPKRIREAMEDIRAATGLAPVFHAQQPG